MTTSWFLDTSVLLLAAGEPHPDRADAVAFMQRARESGDLLHVSVEGVQEFAFHRLRMVGRARSVAEAEHLMRALVLHPFDADIMTRALQLVETTRLRGRDAVHAATALAAGFTEIVSMDRDFEDVPGLRRVAPRDAV